MKDKTDYKKTKVAILFSISVVIVLSYILATFGSHYFLNQKIEVANSTLKNYSYNSFQKILLSIDKDLASEIDLILSDFRVIDSLKSGDRKTLLNATFPIYKELRQKRETTQIMHFHLPNSHSLLRVHNSSHYGDDLSSIRDLITAVIRTKKEHSGFEVGKYGFSYRVAKPIFGSGEFLGVLEIGVGIEYFQNEISKYIEDSYFATIANKESIKKELLPGIFDLVDGVSIFGDLNFFSRHLKEIESMKKVKVLKDGSRYFLIDNSINIDDINKKNIANIVVAKDVTKFYSIFYYELYTALILGSSIWIFLLYIISRGFDYYIRVIDEKQNAIISAFEAANDGLWDWDLKTNRVEFSARWKESLGYEEGDFEGCFEEFKELLCPEDVDSTIDKVKKHLDGVSDIYEATFRLKAKDGTYKWILAKGRAFKNSDNEALRIVGTHTDVTSQVALEKELQAIMDAQNSLLVLFEGDRCIRCNKKSLEFFDVKSIDEIYDKNIKISDFFIAQEGYLYNYDNKTWLQKLKENKFLKQKSKVKMIKKDKIGISTFLVEYNDINYPYTMDLVTFTDITELEKQSIKIENQKNFLDSLINSAPIGIYIKDREFKTTDCNSLFLNMLELEKIDNKIELDDNLLSLFTLKDREHLNSLSSVISFEVNRVTSDKRERHFTFYQRAILNRDGEFDGVVGSVVDMTDQKILEEELKSIGAELEKRVALESAKKIESETKYLNLFEVLNEAVFIQELNERFVSSNIIEVNRAAFELSGYSKDELLKMCLRDIVVFDDKDELYEIRELLRIKKHINIRKSIIRKDKREIIGVIDSYVIDINGVSLLFTTIKDITEELELRDQIFSKEKILIQQSKMASIGEVITAITYQWKHPLSLIALDVQNAKDSYEFGELDLDMFEETENRVMKNIEAISLTIDEFRSFFKPASQKMPFSVLKAIQDVCKMLKTQLMQQNISLFFEFESDYFTYGFKNEFKLVILNILNNSKDAIKRADVKEGKVTIALKMVDNKIEISIEDNGGGIDSSLLPDRLFKAYVSTKKEKESSSGIGLYMTKAIVKENMGGEIGAKNGKDGAIFEITLKKYDEQLLPLA